MSAPAPHAGPAVQPFAPPDATEDELTAVHAMLRACHEETGSPEPYRPLAATLAFYRVPPAGEERASWVVRDAGVPVGLALVRCQLPGITGRLDLHVALDARRRGAGTVLLDAAREYARAAGLRTLLSYHATPGGAGFAASAGAEQGPRNVRAVLRLDGSAPAAPPVAPPPGYRVLSWSDGCPEPLLASYAVAREAINDAPDDLDPELWSPQQVRDHEATIARRGGRALVTVAVHGDGEVAAFTEMRLSAPPSTTAAIDDTAVSPAHRRRGLALAIKSAALAALRADHPAVTLVTTTNAEVNHPIRTVNQHLGFTTALIQTTSTLTV